MGAEEAGQTENNYRDFPKNEEGDKQRCDLSRLKYTYCWSLVVIVWSTAISNGSAYSWFILSISMYFLGFSIVWKCFLSPVRSCQLLNNARLVDLCFKLSFTKVSFTSLLRSHSRFPSQVWKSNINMLQPLPRRWHSTF